MSRLDKTTDKFNQSSQPVDQNSSSGPP